MVGRRFAEEALRGKTIDRLYIDEKLKASLDALIESARAQGINVRFESSERLDERCFDTRHQGVVGLGPPFPYRTLEDLRAFDAPLLIALDEVQDPHNMGAILRSALSFGAAGAIVPKHRAAVVTPVVVRSSAGASERLPIAQVTNLQKALLALKDDGFEIIGLAAGGDMPIAELADSHPPTGRVIVVGSEGSGLRRLVHERCDRIASIPMASDFDSLNASVAAALALYEASRAVPHESKS